ncbi:MAG: DUF2256 and DUF3253 domain-containing protein [Actinobacteria bacterium]|nr:DUF2256 and DUF3253 domain-containing protein [Actinomycetota bacterium]
MVEHAPKSCARCGREISWRAKWAKNWQSIKFCSDACRKKKVQPVDTALEVAILELLAGRAREASICPSEAARHVGGETWRALMEPARMAARRLVERGEVQITQAGRVVDPSRAKGPIRVRRSRR